MQPGRLVLLVSLSVCSKFASRHLPFFYLMEILAEKFPSKFRLPPPEFGEMVENSHIQNPTGEPENLTDISLPDSPSDVKREGV